MILNGFQGKGVISDRLCNIGFKILFISVIGISVKSHIGASLILVKGKLQHAHLTTQLVHSTGANVPVMDLQGYKSAHQKADLTTADMVCGYLIFIAVSWAN